MHALRSGDMFGDHLRAVQRLLQAWGMPEAITLAGLFHSIYGTEGFQDFQLSLDRRDDVKKLIGEVGLLYGVLNTKATAHTTQGGWLEVQQLQLIQGLAACRGRSSARTATV